MYFRVFLIALGLLWFERAEAQSPLVIYSDSLVNGFQNWSWASVNFTNTSPVYSGSNSISVTTSNYSALWLYTPNLDTSIYTTVSFWINGGSVGGQNINLRGVLGGSPVSSYTLPTLAPNTWRQITIPLSSLGVAYQSDFNGFWWQLNSQYAAPTFYLDSIQLNPLPPPPITHLSINASKTLRTADARWFGINTAIWDSDFGTPTTVSELNDMGLRFLRFPGGSAADDYHWASNTSDSNTWHWATSFSSFASVATNIGASAIITANYGTGTPAEAAAWVKSANINNHYGFKYWEVGNELYGTWETDSNANPHDPYTYATRAAAYIQQMKAVDPTIKVGVVTTTGEDASSNGYNAHPATNHTTGQVHYGWTPVVMSTLKQLGVTPDCAIYHWYPEYGNDSDLGLLDLTTNWIGAAANLRGMISNYFGPGGTNIELLCTENNSDAGAQGKQSTSLVNALFRADSFGQLTQTEFNSFVWWDLRNGVDYSGDMDATLYGWRMYGDLGVMNGLATNLTDRYPTYFAAKLMKLFVGPGDSILPATSDYRLLTAYAARRTNGSLSLLVVSKDSATNLTGQISLGSFLAGPNATIYSYGMAQDNAAEAGSGACDIATNSLAATNLYYNFSPYSLTVFSFPPEAPALDFLPGSSSQIVLQISGQPGAPYVLQSSPNLLSWTSVSSLVLTSSPLTVTNAISPEAGVQFWRAAWTPQPDLLR